MNSTITVRTKIFALFSGLWGGFILSNSLKTGVVSSGASDSIVDKIMTALSLEMDTGILTYIVRKLAHFTEFMILGLLISLSFYYIKKRFKYSMMTIFFICLSFGVLDEFVQSFIVGRSSEVRDVVIDFAGALVGYLIVYLIDKKRHKYNSFK